jgi:hypothetical protein
MDASKWYSTPRHKLQSSLPAQLPQLSLRNCLEKKRAFAGARSLGWASIGLGLFEIVAPKAAQQALGLEACSNRDGIMRALGVRELMHGFGILAEKRLSRNLTLGVESRVLGDTLDMALLGVAATKTQQPARFIAVAAAIIGIGLLDLMHVKKLRELSK